MVCGCVCCCWRGLWFVELVRHPLSLVFVFPPVAVLWWRFHHPCFHPLSFPLVMLGPLLSRLCRALLREESFLNLLSFLLYSLLYLHLAGGGALLISRFIVYLGCVFSFSFLSFEKFSLGMAFSATFIAHAVFDFSCCSRVICACMYQRCVS